MTKRIFLKAIATILVLTLTCVGLPTFAVESRTNMSTSRVFNEAFMFDMQEDEYMEATATAFITFAYEVDEDYWIDEDPMNSMYEDLSISAYGSGYTHLYDGQGYEQEDFVYTFSFEMWIWETLGSPFGNTEHVLDSASDLALPEELRLMIGINGLYDLSFPIIGTVQINSAAYFHKDPSTGDILFSSNGSLYPDAENSYTMISYGGAWVPVIDD